MRPSRRAYLLQSSNGATTESCDDALNAGLDLSDESSLGGGQEVGEKGSDSIEHAVEDHVGKDTDKL